MKSMQQKSPNAQPGAAVPPGHVRTNEKWRGSVIVQALQGKLRLLFEEQLGLVDFQLSNRSCILYISETDLVAGSAYKRKLVRFRKACPPHSTVLVERTAISEQYFLAVQQFAVLGLGVTLMPVLSQAEAALVITHLAGEHCKEDTRNPFLPRHNPPGLVNGQVLESILKVPGIGRVKALTLLNYFPSLLKLSTASEDELAEAVGPALAKNVHRFFTQTTNS
uniref:Fanconi anemia core complex-associated protein 24 n=1 Tax=Myxine glutinosa TaxID=7769 RepID=UPI00358E24B9